MPERRVTAVIVSYNSRGVISGALDEAVKAHQAGLLDVVVVDNVSKDGTVEFVREKYPWVNVVQSPGNIGFGRGCNAGLAAAKTEYVLFLNPDASLPLESLRVLVEFLDGHPKALFAAPATVNYGGAELQAAGGLPTPMSVLRAAAGKRTHPAGQRRDIKPGEAPFQTDWLGGGIMLGRCAELRKLGAFDPRFFLYFEETDLCKRAVDAGYELWAVGAATAQHVGGTAAKGSGRKMYRASIAEHYFRSRFYYMTKHFGWVMAVAVDVIELGLLAVRSLAKKVLGRGGHELSERLSGPVLKMPDKPDASVGARG